MLQHSIIYREPGRYAGWPANYGMWHWGNEIVVGFTVGYHKSDERFHTRDPARPFVNVQARSLDGGQSWALEDFAGTTPAGRGLSADEHMQADLGVAAALEQHDIIRPVSTPIDFSQPDTALMCARTGLEQGARSFFYVSSDRAKQWQGPFMLPMFAQTGIAARTDYLVEARHSCLFFLTASKANGEEGKVICVRTQDGGQSFKLVSEVGGEPAGAKDFNIMPSSLTVTPDQLLSAIRVRRQDNTGQMSNGIDLYSSTDHAQTWTCLSQPLKHAGFNGNPPALCHLPDKRLLLIYGNRDKRIIAARLSDDEGETWGDEICLRDKGGCHDLGYPRAVVLADGTVVTAYYFNDAPDGERFIEATRWQP